ncbi:cell division protein FtsQ [Corallibacter vietnamensis]|uniref:Cell division protein FtsQ n=1 Tax=Corallibacter vietnamensis TaxID=904130 RepID=A0ABP7GXY1_9FLAO
MFLLLVLVVFLFAFASGRNNVRKISNPIVEFKGDNNLFITQEAVSKLLIQNQQEAKNTSKETLDLNDLEAALNSNPMIKSADVYVSVNGMLKAEVEQKKPIARVHSEASYYIDEQGGYMPLSSNYSARVPLVTGAVDKNNLSDVFKVAQKIQNDAFLKTHVIEVYQDESKGIFLKLRQYRFTVQLGNLNNLDKKINNLKAFYKKALKDKKLNAYSNVNLKFDSQVVCTKA